MISYHEFLKNPKVKYRIRVGFHTLYILAFSFIYVPSYEIKWPLEFPVFFFRDVFEYGLTSVFVYVLYFVKGKASLSRKIPILVVLGFFMLSSMIILAYFKNQQEHLAGPYFVQVFDDVMQYIGFGSVLFLLFILVDNIDYIFTSKYYKMKKALDSTRNQLLRQQFHPHFLFNALNSVYSMSLNNHPQTSGTILKLSGMMRYLTDEVHVARIPLERELKFLQEYIAIEKIRFGEKANIQFETENFVEGMFIEPLLLVPLVENAFKHGFYINHPDSFVQIKLKMERDRLTFSTQNSILTKESSRYEKREGKGLNNLRSRLQLTYPKTSKLSLSKKENTFVAILELKLDA
ncbi:histidine kinase [Ancylomarina sp. DW003]|nr:histidine kinase [Ancylomarina sp. DW003]MDE5421837.1 histidine kinase [Ancylomarina sp. DW003]